jgi:hypothetical protein
MTIDQLIDQIENETAESGNTRQRVANVLRKIVANTQGTNGVTPRIGDNGNWFIGAADTGIRAEGKDGKDGKDGTNGITPHIGSNNNWFIGAADTGIRAEGKDGKDGKDGVDGKDFEPYEIEDSGSATPIITPEAGAYYKLGTISRLSLQDVPDSVQPIIIRFSSGEFPITVVTPSNLKKQKYFSEVLVLTNTTFEISIVENRITATPFDHDTI